MKLIFLMFITSKLLFGTCYFVACLPEASSGKSQIESNINNVDKNIKKELETFHKSLDEEESLLKEIVKLEAEYIRLIGMSQIYNDYIIQKATDLSLIIGKKQ